MGRNDDWSEADCWKGWPLWNRSQEIASKTQDNQPEGKKSDAMHCRIFLSTFMELNSVAKFKLKFIRFRKRGAK